MYVCFVYLRINLCLTLKDGSWNIVFVPLNNMMFETWNDWNVNKQ